MTINYIVDDTIDYINLVTGLKYSKDDKRTIDALLLLVKDGHSLDEFKLVIDKKWSDWKGTDYQQYVRPETLFGRKFKIYLNEQPRIAKSGFAKLANAVSKAKQTDWKLDN